MKAQRVAASLRRFGFTLVELLIVIVIGGILATISVQFIINAVLGVSDTAERQQMVTVATLVAERISREVRQALPNSVRVFDKNGDGKTECIEFIPVKQASRYLGTLGGTVTSSLEVVSPGAISGYLSVYPLGVSGLYPNGATQAITPETVNFGSAASCPQSGDLQTCTQYEGGGGIAQQFPADSPQKRFFVVDSPVSFCVGKIGGADYLLRYYDYGFTTTAGSSISTSSCPTSSCQVFTDKLKALEFNYAPASLTRAAVVTFSLTLENQRNESLTMNQQVQVRNVP